MKKTLWRGLGLAVLAALLASTAAPASTATAAEPLSVEIVIDQYSILSSWWPVGWEFQRGSFLLTGDVEDRGKVVWVSEGLYLQLQGKNGTLVLECNSFTAEWSVVAGTGAYAGMTGGGALSGTWEMQGKRWCVATYWLIGYLQP